MPTSNPLSYLDSVVLREDACCSRVLAALIWRADSPEHTRLLQRARKLEAELERRGTRARRPVER